MGLTAFFTNNFLAAHGTNRCRTHRRIGADILGDAGSLPNCVAEVVAVDAGSGGILGLVADAAGEDELLLFFVLDGVE